LRLQIREPLRTSVKLGDVGKWTMKSVPDGIDAPTIANFQSIKMAESFEPLKNDLLLRTARGKSMMASTTASATIDAQT
jgi:hypothetical protein